MSRVGTRKAASGLEPYSMSSKSWLNGLLVALLIVLALTLGLALPSIVDSSKIVLTQIRQKISPQAPVQTASIASQTPAPANQQAAETPPPAPKINDQAQVVILGYQRIVDTVRRPETEITPAELQAQMQQLKDQGITVIPLQDLLAWKRGEKNIPANSAVITFDDGWKSQYETAWPLLKKFGYPLTLFVYTDYVRGGPKAGGESLTWEQLAEMRDAGVDIEGQTASHRDLRGKGIAAGPTYETWLWNQLAGSKQILEEHLGIKVNALAVPYGLSNQHVKDVANKAGYEALMTISGMRITHSTPNIALGRFMIQGNKPQIFTAAIQSAQGGAGSYGATSQPLTAVAEFAQKPPTQPPDGAVVTDPKPEIKINVANFGPINPATLSMRIGGVGKVDATYDPATKTLSYKPTRSLTMGPCSVIVSGAGDAKRNIFEARWTFTVERDTHAAASPSPH